MKKISVASSILAVIFFLSVFAQPVGAADTKVSNWASTDIGRAVRLGLVIDDLGTDFTQNITRIQFAELIVSFAEETSDRDIVCGSAQFTDTTNIAALKCAAIGVVKGTGDGPTFSPDRLISREEIVTMLYRAIQYTNSDALPPVASYVQFSDASEVSLWAQESMGCMVGCGIITGFSDNTLAPKASTSIEQAIIMIYRLCKQAIYPEISILANSYIAEQKAAIAGLQGTYTSNPSTFSDSRLDSLQIEEVFEYGDKTYLLCAVKYSLKADNPESVVLFEDTLNGDWLSINATSTLVVRVDNGDLTALGGYTTEFSANGNKSMYKSDFENWLSDYKKELN